jgi:hypothetical protein
MKMRKYCKSISAARPRRKRLGFSSETARDRCHRAILQQHGVRHSTRSPGARDIDPIGAQAPPRRHDQAANYLLRQDRFLLFYRLKVGDCQPVAMLAR